MNVTVRVVASLIATLSLLFAQPSLAALNMQEPASAVLLKKVTSPATFGLYITPTGFYTLSPEGNELVTLVWPAGTPGMYDARVNENGTLTLPAGKRKIMNPNFAVGALFYNQLTGAIAPTGMRRVIEVIAPLGDEFGGHRLVGVTTSYVKAEEMVASTPGAFISKWGWAGAAEAKALWVVNDNPDGVVNDPVLGLTGKYLSKFNLNSSNWQVSERVDYTVSGNSRSIDFDNSRNSAYMPRTSFRTFQAKSLGPPTVSNVANVPDSRLNALVYEPTGEVFHLATSTYGNRVFVYNPKTDQVWDFVAPTGVVPNIDTNVDANVQGAIYGETLFRVLSINGHTQTKVEVYDIPTRTQRASYIIDKKLANGGGIFGARPEISFDPRTNTLWFVATRDGSLGYLELASGVFTNIPISQEEGVAVGATDVEIDTSRKVAYVSIARFRPVWQGAGTPWVNGSLAEFDLATKQIVRQVPVQVYPWSVSMLPTATGTFVAVTNSANQVVDNVNVGSVSVVDVATFTEAGRMQTQRFPTVLAVDFKD